MGRAFDFECLKGNGTQWAARKRNPPDLLGFVKDVYPTFLIVQGISQKSAAVFCATDPPLPRLVRAFCAIV